MKHFYFLNESNLIDASGRFGKKKKDLLPITRSVVQMKSPVGSPNEHREIFHETMNTPDPFHYVAHYVGLDDWLDAVDYLSKNGTDEEKHKILDSAEHHGIGLLDSAVDNIRKTGNDSHRERLNNSFFKRFY